MADPCQGISESVLAANACNFHRFPFLEAITVFGAPHLTLALTSSIPEMSFLLEQMDLQSKEIFVILFVYLLV